MKRKFDNKFFVWNYLGKKIVPNKKLTFEEMLKEYLVNARRTNQMIRVSEEKHLKIRKMKKRG